MMKEDVKKKWLEALRSGEYKQVRGGLCNIENGVKVGHCCLGVLCECLANDGVVTSDASVNRIGSYTYTGLPMAGALTHSLLAHLNLDVKEESNLIRMNDKGKSFVEIADYIEKNV